MITLQLKMKSAFGNFIFLSAKSLCRKEMFLKGNTLACPISSLEISTAIIFLNKGDKNENAFPLPQPKSSATAFLFACFLKNLGKIFFLSSPGYEATGQNLFEASPSYCGTGQISSGGNLQGEKLRDCQSPAICSSSRQL